jgi:hypothetical protein
MHWRLGPEFGPYCRLLALRLQAAISESGDTTQWLFTNLVEQRHCKRICGAIVQGEAEGGKRNQYPRPVT